MKKSPSHHSEEIKDLNLAYFGTPTFSTYVLDKLEVAGIVPSLVVTAPDRPAGRGLELQQSPVKEWALERDIFVLQPERYKDNAEVLALLANSDFDLFVVAAYGKILPKEIVELPRHGALNVHPSLLPRFRGASPIETQILEDEKTVGVSIIVMDEEMDHGPILAQASITPEEWPLKTTLLEKILWSAGGELLAEVIPPYLAGELTPAPQDHVRATFTKKMVKEDGLIDLSADGYTNYLKFCAYDEWPGTYLYVTRHGKSVRVKINDADFRDGAFTPARVTPEGKKEMDYQDFLRGIGK